MWRRARKIRRAERLTYLESVYERGEAERNFGLWVEAPRVEAPRTLDQAAPHLLEQDERRDTCLWPALHSVWPSRHWLLQATGDCVGVSWESLLEHLLAVQVIAGKIRKPDAPPAGEASYAFSKVELRGRYGYQGAGSTGYAVAEATVRFGTLYRLLYEAGSNRCDLREYDDLSILWGDRGRGVPDWLEPLAGEHKAKDRVQIRSALEMGLAIQGGYPCLYCGYTSWGVRRGSDGIATRFASGWHSLAATAVRWNADGSPLAFWIDNKGHGDHCEGPAGPYEMPETYAECGAWVPAAYIDRVARAGDCYSTTLIAGWPITRLPNWGMIDTLGP